MEQKKSRMLRLTLMGGQARVFICDTTELAQQARDIHNASNTCSAAMGRMLAATAIMGANLKSEGDRITATMNVGGALGKDGQLTIMRSFGFGEPYVGRVALVSGEIAEDFAMYYLESEQTPSLCALGTLVGENIISSGGILIQAMPDCSEELLDALEIRAELFSSISQLLSEMTLEEIVEGCFRGLNPEILEEMPLRLQCDCSREYIERVLLSMGENEIRDMIEKQNGCEVECHFCRKHYRFSGEELEALLAQAHKENDGDE